MLSLLNISNIALIDELRVEFDGGLNLLTGETGSGKSIIVDALGILIGGRFATDLIKTGTERGYIEGLFSVASGSELERALASAGIAVELQGDATSEIIIRRELTRAGRNKIFINNQLATQSLLRELRQFLVDIHGQGDQQTLFNPETHIELLDAFAGSGARLAEVADAYQHWHGCKRELEELQRDEAEKFQLVDILKFQIDELERAQLAIGEDATLEEERRRLQNVELGSYESSFRDYLEGLESARAVLEDLSFSLRDFSEKLEFSPARLEQIDNRLAEISSIKRKYGGAIESALEHLARSEDRRRQVEHAGERETEVQAELAASLTTYLEQARRLHRERVRAAKKFEQAVEYGLVEVAMESAKFQVQLTTPEAAELKDQGSSSASASFSVHGIDHVEFYFSANVGETIKPLVKVASGGEASRLMLVLKTVANASEFPRTIVFDEIDSGIGGRVSEAVGAKLKKLSQTNQVLCVTHQPQIARFADTHLLVKKETVGGRTEVNVENLDRRARVEEIARMLTGAEITDSARRHAREMLKG